MRISPRHFASRRRNPVRRTERIRQSASGRLTWDEMQKYQSEGWRLIALEWERDVLESEPPADQARDHEEPPYGLRVAGDSPSLVADEGENAALHAMMELIIQDG